MFTLSSHNLLSSEVKKEKEKMERRGEKVPLLVFLPHSYFANKKKSKGIQKVVKHGNKDRVR